MARVSSYGRDDRDLHDFNGVHLKSPVGDRTRWNARMEAHLELHRRDATHGPTPPGSPWEHGEHIPRQLRTSLAES